MMNRRKKKEIEEKRIKKKEITKLKEIPVSLSFLAMVARTFVMDFALGVVSAQ